MLPARRATGSDVSLPLDTRILAMATKANMKSSKKDRPKSSERVKNKKRESTPEKTETSQHAILEDVSLFKKNVIWNEEIEKLAIKEENLQKLKEPKPPGSERAKPLTTRNVIVRKVKPVNEKVKVKPVVVAKIAPPDAPVKSVDYTGFAGPRYDGYGNAIPYSILGNYENFRKEALKRGDLLDLPPTDTENVQPASMSVKSSKKKRKVPSSHLNAESNALRNWQLKMIERKRQQGHISKLLQKDPCDLLMNLGDNYRQVRELHYLLDQTIPKVDYGKGYRVGSEFWSQQHLFGDELKGIHDTLNLTEKGCPPPLLHIGTPPVIKEEKGRFGKSTRSYCAHNPWHISKYLKTRTQQLKELIEELDPHFPETEGLQIVGIGEKETTEITSCRSLKETSDEEGQNPLDKYPDIYPNPLCGPSLLFKGQLAEWTGDAHSYIGQIALEGRVIFEAFTGEKAKSFLEVENNGTTAVYYSWKKLPKDNPFEIIHAPVQRFYFNDSSGVILPGGSIDFPFIFKSPNHGVFWEQLKFETRPVLCGGADLVVTLRGVAVQEDEHKDNREELEMELAKREAKQIAERSVDELFKGLRTPERARSAIDTYVTDEELFQRKNPELYYHHETVQQDLLNLYYELNCSGTKWNFCISDLKEMVMELEEEEDEKIEEFLQRVNEAECKLSFSPSFPQQENLYRICYQLLSIAVENIEKRAQAIHQTVFRKPCAKNLPETSVEVSVCGDEDEDVTEGEKSPGKRQQNLKKSPPTISRNQTMDKKDLRKAKSLKKKSSFRGPLSPNMIPKDKKMSQMSIPKDNEDMESKANNLLIIKEKLFIEAYHILGNAINRMDEMFQEIRPNFVFNKYHY